MRVLITGATGFLGTRLVARLIDAGHEVCAVVRASSRTELIAGLGADCRVASLVTGEGLAHALRDVDVVVHAAGGGRNRTTAQMYADNRDTTQCLLDACAGLPLKRFVHVSSLAATGPSQDGAAPADRAPTSHYGRSKAAAEDAVLAVAEQLPVTILRPCAVYGPGDVAMAPLFKLAGKGWLLLPGPGQGTAFVHVQDCISALMATIEQDHPSGRVYGVAERTVRNVELPEIMATATGSTLRVVRIPGLLLRFLGLFWDKAADLSQPWWICESAGLRDDFGWEPQVPVEVGFVETMAWYREEGWV